MLLCDHSAQCKTNKIRFNPVIKTVLMPSRDTIVKSHLNNLIVGLTRLVMVNIQNSSWNCPNQSNGTGHKMGQKFV